MIRILSFSVFTGLVLCLNLQLFVQDKLLYFSDPISFLVMTNAVSLILSLPFMLILTIASLLSNKSKNDRVFKYLCVGIPLSLLLSGGLLAVFDITLKYYSRFMESPASYFIESPAYYLIVFFILQIFFFIIYWRYKKKEIIYDRTYKMSLVFSVSCPLLLLFGSGYSHIQPYFNNSDNHKAHHLILLVIDGFPSQHLKTYNPEAKETSFDKAIREGMIFKNARTNRPATSLYFSILYNMNLEYRKFTDKNLINELHEKNVNTKLLNFHRNGIPQTSSRVNYKGFFSSLLTEKFTWFPEILGLHYDVLLSWPTNRRNMNKRLEFVYHLFNEENNNNDIFWDDIIPEQINHLQNMNQPSFLLIHLAHKPYRNMQFISDNVSQREKEFYEKAIESHYRYDNSDDDIVKGLKAGSRKTAELWGERIQKLNKYLNDNGFFENTLLIVTADHGSIYSKNKLWYGYHGEEEVVKVPLIIFGTDNQEIIDANVDTRDIVGTIKAYFDINNADPIRYRNLLGDKISNKNIPALTTPSAVHNEHFLNIYQQHKKYTFNVHPEGDAGTEVCLLSDFEPVACESPIPEDPAGGGVPLCLVCL